MLPLVNQGEVDGHGKTGIFSRYFGCSYPQGAATLDVLILKALVWGPLHGYAITNFIRRQSDDALLVEEGTLYPALWRLEKKRLLDAEWGLSENNRKAKFYRLTPDGRRQLRHEVRTWEAYAAAVAKVISATQPPLPEEMG